MRNYLRLLSAVILMSISCLEVCAGATLTKDAAGMAAGRYRRNRIAYRDAGSAGEGVLWDFSGVDFSGPGHKVVCEGETMGRYRVTGDRKTATYTAELVALHHRFYIKDHLGNNRRVIDMGSGGSMARGNRGHLRRAWKRNQVGLTRLGRRISMLFRAR